ncbi:MAG: hypothetical protein U0325_17815 [Polyangiales bacterium]
MREPDPRPWREDGPEDLRGLLREARGGADPLPAEGRAATAAALARAATRTLVTKISLGVVVTLAAASFVGATRDAAPRRSPPAATTQGSPRTVSPPLTPRSPVAPPSAVAAPVALPTAPPPSTRPHPRFVRRDPSSPSESALLERVRTALARGDLQGARDALRGFDARFPAPALREERDYLQWRIDARGPDAARASRTFQRAHPAGIYTARVRATLEGAP